MVDRQLIASTIRDASPVTRLALAAPDERLRRNAAERLAGIIARALDAPPVADHRQLGLPL